MRLYRYVGPATIRDRSTGVGGTPIDSPAAVLVWVAATNPDPLPDGLVPATFVITPDGVLRIAHRRSEHVACAGGRDVLSAGEVFWSVDDVVAVAEITNQSTGYCPEPESWPAVAAALDAAGIGHPGGFTATIQFRRCDRCGQRNLVKDEVYSCQSCGADLPRVWNFDC